VPAVESGCKVRVSDLDADVGGFVMERVVMGVAVECRP
jgi:hypothetical protein